MQKTMKLLHIKFLLLFCVLLSGCAVDSPFLAKFPGFSARSDQIPGLMPARERLEIIRKKGEYGKKATDQEKSILIAQLMLEYETAPSHHLKREAVDALGKISHPDQFTCLKEVLADSDPQIRISALEAIGQEMYRDGREQLVPLFIDIAKTDTDKDVRVLAMQRLGKIGKNLWADAKQDGYSAAHKSQIFVTLANALEDKQTIIRYEAMQQLKQMTGMDYGNDINRWLEYVQYQNGEIATPPKEKSWVEHLPKIQLPMLM